MDKFFFYVFTLSDGYLDSYIIEDRYENYYQYSELSDMSGKRAVSFAFDLLPFLGEVKLVQESLSGKNLITWEDLSVKERVINLCVLGVAHGLPKVLSKFGGKAGSKVASEIDDVAKMGDEIADAEKINKKRKNIISLRDLMTPEECARHDKYWESVAKGESGHPGMSKSEYDKWIYGDKKLKEILAYKPSGSTNFASTFQSLTRDEARDVVSNLLEDGEISIEDLVKLVPDNTPNTFVPTSTMKDGAKYEFTLADGQKVIIRWHEPDPVAASKFPGCTSGTRYTAEIKVGNKQLKIDGGWSKNQSTNDVHIPIKGK